MPAIRLVLCRLLRLSSACRPDFGTALLRSLALQLIAFTTGKNQVLLLVAVLALRLMRLRPLVDPNLILILAVTCPPKVRPAHLVLPHHGSTQQWPNQ